MHKAVGEIAGSRNIKTMQSTGRRTMTRSARSAHLDIYVLEKKEEMLEKEASLLDKRTAVVKIKLDDIRRELAAQGRLYRQSLRGGRNSGGRPEETDKRAGEKEWNMMGLGY